MTEQQGFEQIPGRKQISSRKQILNGKQIPSRTKDQMTDGVGVGATAKTAGMAKTRSTFKAFAKSAKTIKAAIFIMTLLLLIGFVPEPVWASAAMQANEPGNPAPQAEAGRNRAEQGNLGSGQRTAGFGQTHKKLAIVIDDLGNDMKGTKEVMEMPVKLTVAVMPFLRTTKRDATEAHRRGFDVLVHMPMEPNHGKPEWLGPGAITGSMTDAEVRQRVEEAIDDVPFAVGINNHMGSKITANPRMMSIVLDVCRERGLFFLDSRTNYKTVVGKLCKEKGMPVIGNEFFLDDQYNAQHINKQMNKVIDWMKGHDRCVIIGHVGVSGMQTAGAIRSSIARMAPGVEYVTLSEIVKDQEQSQSGLLPGMLP